jgi:hypothetical protein
VKLKPTSWDADIASLKNGAGALVTFEAKMLPDGFKGC